METLPILCLNFLLMTSVYGQSALFALTPPEITPLIKESSEGYSLFLNLWEFSLKMDTDNVNPSKRGNIEPKTLLLPGDFAMAHLVPQDGTHPLFLTDPKHSQLRQEFILDHLVLDALPKIAGGVVDSEDEVPVTTLSGKLIKINRGARGVLSVGDVRVKKTVILDNGMQIYVLEQPLFNLTQKVRRAFNDFHKIKHDVPIGPPLDIPEVPVIPDHDGASIPRAPAPPPAGTVPILPPAPPKDFLIKNVESDILPPADPIHTNDGESSARAPASSPFRVILPPAPPKDFQIKKNQNDFLPPAPPTPTFANTLIGDDEQHIPTDRLRFGKRFLAIP